MIAGKGASSHSGGMPPGRGVLKCRPAGWRMGWYVEESIGGVVSSPYGSGKPPWPPHGRRMSNLLWSLAFLLLSSCWDVDYFATFDNGGTARTNGMAVGPVTGFGSVKVGGAVFSEDNATTIVDDLGRNTGDLTAGMVLTVRGTLSADFGTGSASSITVGREVRGPVDDNGVLSDSGTIRVLGQTVLVNPATVMVRSGGGEFDIEDLKTDVDNNALRPELEVHGARDDRGFLHASFVGRGRDNVVADETVWLRGSVSGIDGVKRTFLVGDQVVDFSSMPIAGRVDWPITGLVDGLVVDVRGRLDAIGGNGIIRPDRTGDRIEVLKVDMGESGNRVTLEGYAVSGTASSFAVSVPGGTVAVTGGIPPTGAAFGVGERVQVKGKITGSTGTTVQASAIAVRSPNEILLEGSPDAIDPAGSTITLLGMTVEVDDFTLFRDGTGTVRNQFGLADLSTGHTVRVAGVFDGAAPPGRVLATKLERLALVPASSVTAQGAVSAVASPSYTVLGLPGIVVSTGQRQNTDFFLLGGFQTDGATFFQNLSIGTIVIVRQGIFTGDPPRIAEPDPESAVGPLEVEIVRVNR